MNALKELLDTLLRITFGHTTADNAEDWKEAHDKANASRADVEKIVKESEKSL